MCQVLLLVCLLLLVAQSSFSWRIPVPGRHVFGKLLLASQLALVPIQEAFAAPSSWDPKIEVVEVIKAAPKDAPAPIAGQMVAIRFKGSYKQQAFDDTFANDLPYFYRAGAGTILKGLDDTVLHMKVGDRLSVAFGGDYAFPNGRPSSAGKARIPPGAIINYEVELVDLPGSSTTFDEDAMILDVE